jgi:hypothetical protein
MVECTLDCVACSREGSYLQLYLGVTDCSSVNAPLLLLLLLLAGIGVEAVHAVVAAYPTPISLFRAYEACMRQALASPNGNATAAAQGMLTTLQLGSGRQLGPHKARVVYEKLFMNGWDVAAR